MAHSNGLALYAVTRLAEIGIDIERIRPGYPDEEIARRFFSANELRCLLNLPIEIRQLAFFNCWTRKEAFIKANGMGLSLPLDDFEVTLNPAEPAMILWTQWDDKEAAQWSLRTIETDPDFVAAVAIRAHNWQLDFRHFEAETLLIADHARARRLTTQMEELSGIN